MKKTTAALLALVLAVSMLLTSCGGDGFILAARECVFDDGERGIFASELLGSTDRAGDILASLGYSRGILRTVGDGKPFSSYLSLDDAPAPTWFAFEM